MSEVGLTVRDVLEHPELALGIPPEEAERLLPEATAEADRVHGRHLRTLVLLAMRAAQKVPARRQAPPPDTWSADDVARRLGVSRETVYRLANEGKIPGAFRVGGTDRLLRFDARKVEDWIRARQRTL